ncbi:MAG: bifunctional metallophosphatase/5'-nucleotidase [Lactobacillaceae bacterium]|jgi:2',3'-cyclic-nucleotide 2'-phosphodiesterase/3'-nucleotidase|nr:bifunctional metallophosphatase/5'-nucleotidase [Lactobacillaceae bacterium]
MQVKIVSTSDVHGYVRADDFRRPLLNDSLGLTKAATAIKQIETTSAADDIILKIENGDFIQGSPLTNYIEKVAPDQTGIYRKLANTIGYDVRIIGNHEFNYGRDYLEKVLGDDQTILNANIIDTITGEPFIGRPYAIFERQGVKIGVIGLTTKYIAHWEHPSHIQNLAFLDPVELAAKYISELRDQVDIIVLAYHGGFAEDLVTGAPLERLTSENQGYQLLQLPGVDALVTGHQHRKIATVAHNVATTQPGYRGDNIGVISLELDGKQQIIKRDARLEPTGVYPEMDSVAQVIAPLQTAVDAWLDKPVGHVGDNMQISQHFLARLQSHPFVELVNRVQMAATGTHIANTALFNDEVRGLQNAVTLRDIMTNYIYPNTLVVEALTGQDIWDALNQNGRYFVKNAAGELAINEKFIEPKVQHYNYDIWSGVEYTFDFSRPFGDYVTTVTIDGQPIDLTATYEVTMNNYRAGGAGNFNMFASAKIVREVQIETSELIGDYIMQHPAIQIDQPKNITAVGYEHIKQTLLTD